MANPLISIGPGGDYTARYFVKGAALAKQVGSRRVGTTLGQQPDTETAGSFAGYSQRDARQQRGYSDDGQRTVDGDAFEPSQHVEPATYGKSAAAGPAMNMSAQVAAAAAEAWLAAQQRTLIAIPLYSPAQAATTGSSTSRPIVRRPVIVPRKLALTSTAEPAASSPRMAPTVYRAPVGTWPRVANPMTSSTSVATVESAPPQIALIDQDHDHEHEPHAQTASHSHSHSRPAPHAGLLADHAGAGRRTGREQGDRLRARRGAHQKGSALARSQQGSLFNG